MRGPRTPRVLLAVMAMVVILLLGGLVWSAWRGRSNYEVMELQAGRLDFTLCAMQGRLTFELMIEHPTHRDWRIGWRTYSAHEFFVQYGDYFVPERWRLYQGVGGVYRLDTTRTGLASAIVVLAALAWLGAELAIGARRRIRRRRGLCAACGYNLRGVVGDCPECGEPCHRPETDSATAS